MAKSMNLEKQRPLGRLETFSTARHHLGLYKAVGCSATYLDARASSRTSTEKLVFGALHHAILKYPSLSAIPINEDQSYPTVYFARLPSIDLRTCVEFRKRKATLPRDGDTDNELEDLLAEQHNIDFKLERGSKPFWRLIVLKSADGSGAFTASWFYHHALADGASALLFHQTLLEGLNAPSAIESGPIVPSPETPLLPPLESLHPMPISWGFFLHIIARAVLPSIFAKRPQGLWTGRPVPADISSIPPPHHRSIVFSAQTTRRLAHLCRREKTSVTAVLQSFLAAALFYTLPADECERLQIEGPISIRSLLDVESDQMISAISQYTFIHLRKSGSPASEDGSSGAAMQHFSWDEARAVKSAISAVVAKQGRDNPIALLKYVSDMPKFFLEKLGQHRSPSAELSNVGLWKGKQGSGGDWTVGRMTFSQCPTLTSNPIMVNVITGGDGNAVAHFCWIPGAVGDDVVDGVVEQFKMGVEGLVERS